MSEYHSFSLPQNATNTSNSEEVANKLSYNRQSFSIHQGEQANHTAALNNESNNWSDNDGNTFQTSLDSILNEVSDFHHTSRHVQSNTTNTNDGFNRLFDFLPSFNDHLILPHQPNTKNSSTTKDTGTVHISTNNNVISQMKIHHILVVTNIHSLVYRAMMFLVLIMTLKI